MPGQEVHVPGIKVLRNNTEIEPAIFGLLGSVTVEDEINVPSMFSLVFNLQNLDQGGWFGIDLETFKLGDTVTVKMGFDSLEDLVVGEITDIEPTYSEEPYLIIRGFDRLHRLRFGKFRKSYQEMSDADIVRQIAVYSGLSATVEDTQTVYPYVFQNNESNYDFLLYRVKRIGYELRVRDQELILRPSQESGSSVVTLEWGSSLDFFTAQLRTLTEGSTVEVRGWDPADKSEITGTAQDGDEKSQMEGQNTGFQLSNEGFEESKTVVYDEQVIDGPNADQISKGLYNDLLRQFLTGEGECMGNPLIRAGEVIELQKIGERFSGSYYVTSSKHEYNRESGYYTKFVVERSGA